ncbi:MAG: hypothetical protein AAF542_03660 [Pseudomonadota bacterium]
MQQTLDEDPLIPRTHIRFRTRIEKKALAAPDTSKPVEETSAEQVAVAALMKGVHY